MNKVLFFYPSFTGADQEKPLYTDIPMSVVAIAQALHNKVELEVIDERVEDKKLALEDVIAVGISATTSYQIINGLRFAQKVREKNPNIKMVWGGWHASLMPYETIQHPLVDILIIGQGEVIWERLLDCLIQKKDLSLVPNILYKGHMGIVKESKREVFDHMQMPKSMRDGYRYINMERYIHSAWGHQRVLGYESSRGCPNACTFCSISAIFQRKWYGLPAINVYEDICFLKEKYHIDAIHFFDNNFFVDKKRALEFSNYIKRDNINVSWDGTVTVKQFLNFTQKEINCYKEAGCFRIIAGIESGDPVVLSKIRKNHSNEEVIALVHRCKDNGLLPSLSFMVGFPWNPEEDTKNTIELIEQIKSIEPKTEILLFVFSPYLGTPLYTVAKEYGMKFPDSLEGWAQFTYDRPNTPWVTSKQQRKIGRYLSFFGTKEIAESEKIFLSSMNNNA